MLCCRFVNRDLYNFKEICYFNREFTPAEAGKGNYLATEGIPLKKGIYQLFLGGKAEKAGSYCIIVDSSDEIIFSEKISPETEIQNYSVNIPNNTTIRVGVSYDPVAGKLDVKQMAFTCDTILYRDSVLRHALISGLVLLLFTYIGFRLFSSSFIDRVKRRYNVDLPHCERIILWLLSLTLLSIWPLFDNSNFVEGDDFYFHLTRIEALSQTLKAGYVPSRIYLGWMQNYGVGSGFYYPDLLLYLPAALRIVGFPVITCYKVFLVVSTFFSALTMYIAAKRIGNNKVFCGLSSAALYTFASYRLVCIFYRSAVGEIQAFIFFPLIIYGLYEILNGNEKNGRFLLLVSLDYCSHIS